MSKTTFLVLKMAIVIFLGAIIGFATEKQLWYLVAPAVLAAIGTLYTLSQKIGTVVADERDYKIAGQAGRAAYTIYSLTAAIMGTMALAISDTQPQLLPIAYTLLYSSMALVALYAVLFTIYRHKNDD